MIEFAPLSSSKRSATSLFWKAFPIGDFARVTNHFDRLAIVWRLAPCGDFIRLGVFAVLTTSSELRLEFEIFQKKTTTTTKTKKNSHLRLAHCCGLSLQFLTP
jgi:hypothetical protein